MTITFPIPLPNNGMVLSGPRCSGKTTLLYAYLKEIAQHSNSIAPDVLIIADRYSELSLKSFHDDHGIPLDSIDIVPLTSESFPNLDRYLTVVFAIELDSDRNSRYGHSRAYAEFVEKINSRARPPFTLIMVDSQS